MSNIIDQAQNIIEANGFKDGPSDLIDPTQTIYLYIYSYHPRKG